MHSGNPSLNSFLLFFVLQATHKITANFCLVYRSLVAVSEVYLKDYFDRSLSGALADQVRQNYFLVSLSCSFHLLFPYTDKS